MRGFQDGIATKRQNGLFMVSVKPRAQRAARDLDGARPAGHTVKQSDM